MQLPRFRRIILLYFFIVIFSCQNTKAHQLGMTVSNIKYNKETLTLTTRIFYGDFYQEFKKYCKDPTKDYVKSGINPDDKKDFIKYFNKHIRIWIDKSEIHFNSININFERHESDSYILLVDLSYKADIRPHAKIKIRNTVLLNTIGGQKHMINVYLKDPTILSHGIITLDKSSPEYIFEND